MIKDKSYVLWFDEVGLKDASLVGGKNAALGEMYSYLKSLGIRVPNGFAITSFYYNYFIEFNHLKEKISEILRNLDIKNIKSLQQSGAAIRSLILEGEFPPELKEKIEKFYDLLKENNNTSDVAVRSSATAEDLPGASFAGQQETYLNVKGKGALMIAVKKCFASLFTNRALSYRVDKGFGHFKVSLSVGVQRMVRSDEGSSGVAFTIDTETGFDKVIIINGVFGLGELIVQGRIVPDEWIIFKDSLRKGYHAIISKKIGDKNKKIIYSDIGGTKQVSVSPSENSNFSLSDEEVLILGNWCQKIEDHFSKIYKKKQPMDIEWAKDGKTGKLFIIQARPETVYSQMSKNEWVEYNLLKNADVITKGIAVGTKIASGKACVVKSVSEIKSFRKNEILVTVSTDPDWEPIMKIAGGIVTEKGGRTSHAAIVARELGIASVVGAKSSSSRIKNGEDITIDCSNGVEGIIYKGVLPYEVKKHNLENVPKTRTNVMVNIGSSGEAFKNHNLPVRGVGLGRIEFIITSEIKIHPKALIDYPNIDEKLKRTIDRMTLGYNDKKQYYVDNLTYGIAKIASSFWPYQVLIRFSDFKSNEYRSLIGGAHYEPFEENPMIGFRGASRYYSDKFCDAFRLEVKAIKNAREKLGLLNIVPFIPFVRTIDDLKKSLNLIEEEGLKRDVAHIKVCQKQVEECAHLRIYMMCEVPSNVILADKFLELVDGYSIGSNDLTQLTLGIDRDSEILARIGNENDEAVKISIQNVIKKCKDMKKYIGLCGQGPSDSIEFAKFLVENKIDSLSLNPDSVVKTILAINKIEKKL